MANNLPAEFNLGDKIILKIENSSEAAIKENFSDFEIEKIVPQPNNSFLVEMRSFDLGEKKVLLDGKEINFNIKSNLTGTEKEIFMDLTDKSNQNIFLPNFPYFFVLSFIIIGFGIYLVLKRQKKVLKISPEEKYLKQMKELSPEKWNFEISYNIREYIDSIYHTNFLKGEYKNFENIGAKEINFIKDLDTLKFSGKFSENIILDNENSYLKKANEIFENIRQKEIDKLTKFNENEKLKKSRKIRMGVRENV